MALALVASVLVVVSSVSCQRVPLLAPSGSTITLTALANALSANGTTTIVGQVLEASGTPPHSGTHVSFTTSLGRIEPPDVITDITGRVTVSFIAGGSNGTATISAISGGATTGSSGAIKIAVGTAAVGRVTVNASPAAVPAGGGSTTVTAMVIDVNGNPLVATPVSFVTTAGTLSSGLVLTDNNGHASSALTTSTQATVTASVGAQVTTTSGTGTGTTTSSSGQASGSVTVNVSAAPTITITAPTTSPTRGLPAFFTFTVTAAAANGSAIKEVIVNWGDGIVQSLGSFTGASSSSHAFQSDGGFLVTATVVDTSGGSNSASASVTVLPAAAPSIVITAPTSALSRGLPAFFTFTVTAATNGSPVRDVTVNWGDGTVQAMGSFVGAQSTSHAYANEGNFLVSATVNDVNGNSNTSSTAVTVLALARPSVSVTAAPLTQAVNGSITFTIAITVPTGLGLTSTSIDFSDGSSQQLGGAASATVSHSYTSSGTKTVTVTVVDTTGRSTSGTTNVVITP